jgi:hypothetical protein
MNRLCVYTRFQQRIIYRCVFKIGPIVALVTCGSEWIAFRWCNWSTRAARPGRPCLSSRPRLLGETFTLSVVVGVAARHVCWRSITSITLSYGASYFLIWTWELCYFFLSVIHHSSIEAADKWGYIPLHFINGSSLYYSSICICVLDIFWFRKFCF